MGASIHPYRGDALEALQRAKAEGARAVKWLPASMNIDPASARCQAFYEELTKRDLPLIVHCGEERAVLGAEQHDFGNPLRMRRALEAGVRVVIAHCASMGEDRDLDQGANGPMSTASRSSSASSRNSTTPRRYSAMTQVNRAGPALSRVIEESGWHARLLNGSDYPLPGVMPIFSVDYLVSLQLLSAASAPVLKEIRSHNPLLFDFVLKRALRSNAKALAAGVFETRAFFMRCFCMSGNTFGLLYCVTSFGESHGPAYGGVVDGCPPGLELKEEDIQKELDRRKPAAHAT